jgi:protein-tyrosine phosphatase
MYPYVIAIFLLSYYYKPILYNFGIIKQNTLNTITERHFYNHIIYNIYLGSLPLNDHDDMQNIMIKNNINVVISINEEFELKKSLLFNPITEEQYKNNNIIFYRFDSPDFMKVDQLLVDQICKIINKHDKLNHNIYIHCKSGIGRSPTVLYHYLIEYYNMKSNDVEELILNKRTFVNIQK